MSGVNPYINPTCPSQRFCKNHKYNTEGLFSGFYNENSSIHCGQQNIEMPRYQKLIGGSALPGNVYVNVSPGEQLTANNGVEFTDIHTDSSMAGMRTGYAELEKDPSINLSGRQVAKKENFYTDYSSKPSGYEYGNMSTSSTVVKPLLSSIQPPSPKQPAQSTTEKFCAACKSPCGCAVIGVIMAILIVWLLVLWFNHWSKSKTGRGIFYGGSSNKVRWHGSNNGNMNLLGGGEEKPDEKNVDGAKETNEFAII